MTLSRMSGGTGCCISLNLVLAECVSYHHHFPKLSYVRFFEFPFNVYVYVYTLLR